MDNSPLPITDKRAIVIFDGVCNMCNEGVNLIMRHDKHDYFAFSANQHNTGKAILAKYGIKEMEVDTIYLYENNHLFAHSTAALRIARKLRFPLNLATIGFIAPTFIRDAIYKWIAKNRYRWFGKKDLCRLPTPAERAKFLP